MTASFIQDCWRIICDQDIHILTNHYYPLYHMDQYLDCFDLKPLLLPEIHAKNLPDIHSIMPCFKDLNDTILFSLRHNIYTQTHLNSVEKWAEKLMRFCEIRYSDLKKRAIKKCKNKSAAQLHILHLATFLMDHSILKRDIRLLNTVLKLSDLKWLIHTKTLINKLDQKNHETSIALFQFRIILMTEYCILKTQHL